MLARSVFESALEAANRESTEDKNAYLTAAYMTAYNIASNTWPDWNEGDVDEEHRQVWLEFANIHVSIVAQLDLPPEKGASAFWLGAAHELAVKNYDVARSLYEKAKMLGEERDSNEVALMNQGWMLVVNILQGNEKAESELEGLQQRLAGLSEDGKFYAGQFNDALEVFRN